MGRNFSGRWQKAFTPLACVAHLSSIKEQFVNDDGSVWKEASVAICENLLFLQLLETRGLGANEDSVPAM